ncbi:MAG: preprotein translocase subunit SecY [Candidatus Omnitrophica bacterium CG11_big_fil_rev_8_21_14_0_20_45_26]|uniref:Protein translocase subunit SecY n=1 Tax=Candidatus Abzuiibacterium crystallinum TaxID=1974748 RepID=A0A2H0LND5_9BACT|nr:MAG: preprotein translocase subunit SecY [Candidatus Omnitrophica bacterium CG11_big_fil_rev_8_21_14_0_20_45_26]PIW65091.1 MAG: preprotein translocase subunit SecY [Candidatus Omnitrophica bacterium CG12_big_fil_rev_8_21_14_0_65_45_16]
MWRSLGNIFKIPDLRKKVLFTLFIIAIYRVGAHIPTPGIDGNALNQFFQRISGTTGGNLFGIMGLFSGGALQRATIFALGIMPYISSSIIMQLLTVVIPHFEKLAKDGGEEGRKELIQYTRYGTIILALIQTFFISLWLENPNAFQGTVIVPNPGWSFRLMTILTLTTGTAFIMWLAEQIDEAGIGNGMSILITAGIIEAIPTALFQTYILVSPFDPSHQQLAYWKLGLMAILFVVTVVGVILVIQGQRKIPVQYAKQIRGHRVYGGQSTYLPLKVNQAGVIPIIFAQSIILFPATIAGFFPKQGAMRSMATWLSPGSVPYESIYFLLIIFFTFFYTAITFNPIEVSKNLQKYGGFIPGVRPGKNTAEHLDYMMTRIAFSGAIFLGLLAIFPSIVSSPKILNIPFLVASFMGGTGLLIIVGVVLDTMKTIESQLLMRHYEGFVRKGKLRARVR